MIYHEYTYIYSLNYKESYQSIIIPIRVHPAIQTQKKALRLGRHSFQAAGLNNYLTINKL